MQPPIHVDGPIANHLPAGFLNARSREDQIRVLYSIADDPSTPEAESRWLLSFIDEVRTHRRVSSLLQSKIVTASNVYCKVAAVDAFLDQLNTVKDEYPGKDGKGYHNPWAEKGTEARPDNNIDEEKLRLGAVEMHESPDFLPPRDDLRRHIDEDEVEKKEAKIAHLMGGLSLAAQE